MFLGTRLFLGLTSRLSASGCAHHALGWVRRSRRATCSLNRSRHRRRGRLRPGMQHLEGRRLLSTFTVSRADDATEPVTLAPVPGTLRWAVLQADSTPDSTIVFDPAVFATPTTIALSSGLGQLELSAPVTIEGPAATVTVDAQGKSRVFLLDPSVAATISGLSITGGSTTGSGGAIDVGPQSSLVLENCTISASSAKRGAGLYSSGKATLTNCTIVGNSATQFAGAVLSAYSTISLTNCTFSGNVAPSAGGLNVYHGTAILVGCTISGNTAESRSAGYFGGGGMVLNASSVAITACTISGNYAASTGGGIDVHSGSVRLAGSKVSGNSAAGAGGGINVSAGTVLLSGCNFARNVSDGTGGGLNVSAGTVSLTGCTLSSNLTGGDGGGLNVSAGAVAVTRCVFSHNVARGTGGGLNVSAGSVSLADCTFMCNRSGGTGNELNVSGGEITRNGSHLAPRIRAEKGMRPINVRMRARFAVAERRGRLAESLALTKLPATTSPLPAPSGRGYGPQIGGK